VTPDPPSTGWFVTPNAASVTWCFAGRWTGLGRNLKHLVVLLDDLHALGIGVITLREGLDWTTPRRAATGAAAGGYR